MTIKAALPADLREIFTIAERMAKTGQLPDNEESAKSFCVEINNMVHVLNTIQRGSNIVKRVKNEHSASERASDRRDAGE